VIRLRGDVLCLIALRSQMVKMAPIRDSRRRGAIIIIMQRLHEDDLVGHILWAGGLGGPQLSGDRRSRDSILRGGFTAHRQRYIYECHDRWLCRFREPTPTLPYSRRR
jgi:hypothetical protein